jgi:hypothetical protein
MDPVRVKTIKTWRHRPPQTYRCYRGFANFIIALSPRGSAFYCPFEREEVGSFILLTLFGTFEVAPYASAYKPERHSGVETDASEYALGGIFSQLYGLFFSSKA